MANRVAVAALAGLGLLSCLGCAQPTPDEAVRKRWNQFVASALDGDTEAGLQVFDPAYVARQGPEAAKQRLKGFGEILRSGRIKAADLRIDKVTIGPDGKTAEVNHSMRTSDGKWLAQAPLGSWVAVDNNWYITWSEPEEGQ
jgi:hypothetical protein